MEEIYLTSNGNQIKISHFPGWTRYKYQHLIDKFSKIKIKELPENLQIITCVDDDSANNGVSPLINQLKYNEIPFINAAEHKDVYPWVNNKKIKLINNALKNVNSEYCLILDGIDVTINDNLDDVIDIFKTYNKDIIFNATPWMHPKVMLDMIPNRRDNYGKYCFLNAGCCIGKTDALREFYSEAVDIFNAASKDDEQFLDSEQYFIRKVFANHMDTVFFDYDCRIFQVWHKTKLSSPEINENGEQVTYRIIDTLK